MAALAFHPRNPVKSYSTIVISALMLSVMLVMPPAQRVLRDSTRLIQAPDLGALPLSFVPNAGQANASARYTVNSSGGTILLTASGIVLSLPDGNRSGGAMGEPGHALQARETSAGERTSKLVSIDFLGANPSPGIVSGEALPGRVNYIVGRDPGMWRTDLPTYAGVSYEQLYAGVTLHYGGTDGNLKGTYDIEVGADPSRIRWRYAGVDGVSVDEGGNLVVRVGGQSLGKDGAGDPELGSVLVEQAPVAWQDVGGKRVAVKARYEIAEDGSIGFALGEYDKGQALTIDPTLTYATYLGGYFEDGAGSVALDAEGNIYVTGATNSSDFPTAGDPFQPGWGGQYDAYVSKISADGSTLIYSTFLGGSGQISGGDFGQFVWVDPNGNALVAGYTDADDFPTTPGAYQTTFEPTYDLFVTKLNATGSGLIFSTYYGGGVLDPGGFTVDAAGNIYMTGYAYWGPSPDRWAYVVALNDTGSRLIFERLLGGHIRGPGDENADSGGRGIAVDAAGNVYVTGYTRASDFPITPGAYRTFIQAYEDGFMTKLDPTGQTIAYSTYIPGGVSEYPEDVAVDAAGNAYVAGGTSSADYPTTPGAFQRVKGDPRIAFVTKFNPSGSDLVYSTFLGDTEFHFEPEDYAFGIKLNSAGNAYVVGYTSSAGFPVANPIQGTMRGPYDAFVTRFNAAGSALDFSTFLGGDRGDSASGITLDAMGSVYVAGGTNSLDFPVVNPVQGSNHGGSDGFIAQIAEEGAVTRTRTPTRTGTPATSTPTPTPGNCQMPGVWRYEPTATLPRAKSAAAVLNGQLYVIGGEARSPTPYPRQVERFDPAANSWTTLAPIPNAPTTRGAVAVGNRIYVLVSDSVYSQAIMQIYDAATNSWSAGAALPERLYNGALAAYNGKVYIFGGQETMPSNHVYEYDPSTNSYAAKAPMPSAQAEIGAATLGNRIYVVGGWQYIHYAYDPVADTWSTIAEPPTPSFSVPGVFAFGGELWVIGGYDNGTRHPYPPSQQVQIYNPGSNRWRFGPILQNPRYYSTAVGVLGSRAYVFGGIDYLSDNYPYDYLNSMESIEYGPCGSVTPTATPVCTRVVEDVAIESVQYNPIEITITVGSSIRWTNYDIGLHTATSDTGEWDSGELAPFQTYRYTFNTPGVYRYHCNRYGVMHGTIRVLACPSTPAATSTLAVTSTPSGTRTQTPGAVTWTPSATRTPGGVTGTPTGVPTSAATSTPTRSRGSLTPVPCGINFSDVQPADFFYEAVVYLYCGGAITGYSDGTFRPYNNTTRGQLSKIVVLAEGWQVDCPSSGHFLDVPTTHPFYCFVETAFARGVVAGYADGRFRPESSITRAQLSKLVVLAAGWADECPELGHFLDVPSTHPFYCFIETAYGHGVLSGYADGTFRPYNSATRGQISKIVYEAVTGP